MSAEPLILSVETATLAGAVALSKGAEIIATLEGDKQTSHSNTLLREISSVLNQAGRTLAEVDLFAVATGPGSFTGLRIGIATVKGLAFTLERPCVAIPTLEAIAHSAGVCERVVAALPAGRGELFVQAFRVSAESITSLDIATHISPDAMLEKYRGFNDICWAGEGTVVHRDKIKTWAEHNGQTFTVDEALRDRTLVWRLLSPPPNLAVNVAMLARHKAQNNELQNPKDLKAIYVRPSDAELKLRTIG
ncbi:MAG TPA: tRNA (adenosine(37)-N6)-threonylcarbamoyltransferase complex dimerization subunit type 1 TsaB [Pyrinomonadaceae bacterium]|nr:tRNA (adenosine(37)-N6)-threonylcarbamoyltransferase complex dimerization subunit type 1 TsaB [Pyrinomonadaceae bacterium]